MYSSETPSRPHYESDLISVWAGLDGLRVNNDPVDRARCGTEKTIRVERILFTGTPFDDASIINRQALLMLSKIEQDLSEQLSSRDAHCFLANCASISPLLFWDPRRSGYNFGSRSFTDLQFSEECQSWKYTVDATVVVSGRDTSEDDSSFIEYASFLTVTYLFHETDCDGSGGHDIWVKAMKDSLPSFSDAAKKQEPVLFAFEVRLQFAQK